MSFGCTPCHLGIVPFHTSLEASERCIHLQQHPQDHRCNKGHTWGVRGEAAHVGHVGRVHGHWVAGVATVSPILRRHHAVLQGGAVLPRHWRPSWHALKSHLGLRSQGFKLVPSIGPATLIIIYLKTALPADEVPKFVCSLCLVGPPWQKESPT